MLLLLVFIVLLMAGAGVSLSFPLCSMPSETMNSSPHKETMPTAVGSTNRRKNRPGDIKQASDRYADGRLINNEKILANQS